MFKKKLILIPALLLVLSACGPTDTTSGTTTTNTTTTTDTTTTNPTTTNTTTTSTTTTTTTTTTTVAELESLTISNKDELLAQMSAGWSVGDADLTLEYTAVPSSIDTYDTMLTSGDTSIVTTIGNRIHAVGVGTTTVTAELLGKTDTLTVTVSERTMKTVTVSELVDAPANAAQLYQVTGIISRWQKDDSEGPGSYGNFYLKDLVTEDEILVYGLSKNESSLQFDEATGKYTFRNDQTALQIDNLYLNNKLTMIGFRLDYNSTKEFNGYCVSIEVEERDEVTSIEDTSNLTNLGVGSSYDLTFKDSNGDTTVGRYGNFELVSGQEYATLEGKTLTGKAVGSVTYKVTSATKPEISDETTVQIVEQPDPKDSTLANVIALTGDAMNSDLYRIDVTVKGYSDNKGNIVDEPSNYGNMIVTDDSENEIMVYGLNRYVDDSFRYYNSHFSFTNARNFIVDNTPALKVGDKFTMLAIRSDYQGTKQITGSIDQEKPEVQYSTIAEVCEMGEGASAQTQGIIVAKNQRSLLINDGTASILLFVYEDAANWDVGDFINVSGTLDVYNDLPQFVEGAKIEEGTGTKPTINETVTTWTATEFDAYSSDRTYGNSKVRLENITLKMSGDYPFFTVPGATTEGRIAYPESMYGFDSANNGRHFNIEGYMIGYSTNSNVTRNLIIVTKAEDANTATPTGIEITGQTSVVVGDTLQLTANVTPSNADRSVTWESSDTSVATVDQNGLVSGLKVGTTTIKVTSKVAASVTAELTINVIEGEIIPFDKIEEVTQMANDSTFTTRGYWMGSCLYSTQYGNYNASYIADGEFGYLLYRLTGSQLNGLNLVVGETIVEVTGTVANYNGLYEGEVSSIKVITDDSHLEKPVILEINAANPDYTLTNVDQNRMVEIDDAVVTNVSVGQHDNTTITFKVGTGSIQYTLYLDSRYSDMDLISGLKEGDTFSCTTYVGYHNGFQFTYIPEFSIK